MIAEGQVFPDRVTYNALPWKFAAGTPDILGTIVSAQALRPILDLALSPTRRHWFATNEPIEPRAATAAMERVAAWNRTLTAHALTRLARIPNITIYGPSDPARRTALVAHAIITGVRSVPPPRRWPPRFHAARRPPHLPSRSPSEPWTGSPRPG